MHKVILLLKRRVDLSSDEFTRLWLEEPSSRNDPDSGPLQHVHNRAVSNDTPIENAPAAVFDAADEFWFDDAEAASTYFASSFFRESWMAPRAKLLAQEPLAISGEPTLIWSREAPLSFATVKILTLPTRHPGLTQQAFADHWINTHSALALEGPGTRERLQRLEACPCGGGEVTPFGKAPFDGMGVIEFGSREALQAEFASTYYRDVMAPDELNFTEPSRSSALMVEPFPTHG